VRNALQDLGPRASNVYILRHCREKANLWLEIEDVIALKRSLKLRGEYPTSRAKPS
jgi:hypothetical protein